MKVEKQKKVDVNEALKNEIAQELGLMDKVKATGWKSLTAKESGRIGGLISKKKREHKEQ
ncbi:MAG: small, acid-soluble spore protein, alpha/beta type [Vallitaleaceae bacterium]|nr:small, acid-soluble spore protein, alpha/beta type [Vallitaleaceae bacterium]